MCSFGVVISASYGLLLDLGHPRPEGLELSLSIIERAAHADLKDRMLSIEPNVQVLQAWQSCKLDSVLCMLWFHRVAVGSDGQIPQVGEDFEHVDGQIRTCGLACEGRCPERLYVS